MIERDDDIPTLAELIGELNTAREIAKQAIDDIAFATKSIVDSESDGVV